MQESPKKKYANVLTGEIIFLVIFFIGVSYLAHIYKVDLQESLGDSIFSMIFYVFIFIVSVVAAPINSEPLIPVASAIWGWFLAGLLTLLGWTIGSLIAFILARHYGLPLVKKFISLEKITQLEKLIPEKHLFISVIFLRMTVQVDALSYILGFLTTMKPRTYFVASLIGLAPLAFLLAYIGEQPLVYQLIALSIGLTILLTGLLLAWKKMNKRLEKNKIKK